MRRRHIQNGYHPLEDKETKLSFNPKTTPFHSTKSSEDFKRWAEIHQDLSDKLHSSKRALVEKGGNYARLAEITPYDLFAFNKANQLAEKGWFQNNKELQKKFILKGWWPLRGSQYSEVGFTLGNIALTAYGADVNDPLFWAPFLISIFLGPLQLVPNWCGVNPGTGKIDPTKKDDELSGLDGDLRDLIAPPTKIKETSLGCVNDFDTEFLLELAKYIAKEDDNSSQILSSSYKYVNYLAFFVNNTAGPPGNWMFFGYFVNKIANIYVRLTVGILTFIPVLITGFTYYSAFTLEKNQIANEQMFSSRNRIVQTAKLSFPLAFQAFYDFASNCLLRGLMMAATFLIALENMGFKEVMSEDNWNIMCTFMEYALTILLAINTASSRIEVYGRFTKPFQFETHLGETQTITNWAILNWKNIRPYVKSKLTFNDYTRNLFSSLISGVCYTLPVAILVWQKFNNPDVIIPGSAVLYVLTVGLDFYNQMTHLINTRASEVIRYCRGRGEEKPVTRQTLNFVYSSLTADAIMRIFTRSAVIGALSFVQDLKLSKTLLWIASAAGAVPSAANEFWFYFLSSIKNSPDIITDIQESAAKGKPPAESKSPSMPAPIVATEAHEAKINPEPEEKPGCGERAKRFISSQLVYYLPCFFGGKKQSESKSEASETKEITVRMAQAQYIMLNGRRVKVDPKVVEAEQIVVEKEKQLRWF